MRVVISNEALDRVANELDDKASDKVEDLWQDTNPLVSFFNHIRPNLNISSDNFLVRLRQAAHLLGADEKP